MADWKPIETAPEGVPILVFVPRAHRGRDSCEVVVVVRIDGPAGEEMSFWTNGGANGGDNFNFGPGELAGDNPTHWQPLPEAPG